MCTRKYITHSKCTLLIIYILNMAVCYCSWHFCTFFRYYVAFICLYYQPAKPKRVICFG